MEVELIMFSLLNHNEDHFWIIVHGNGIELSFLECNEMRNGNITNMFLMKIIIETGNFISTQNIVQIGQPCCTPLSKMENKTIRLVSRHFFVYKTYGSSIMATSWSKWVTVWIYRYLNFIMFIQGINGIQWGPKIYIVM